MNDRRVATLRAVCDTVVPVVEPPAGARGAHPGFWARRASDLGTQRAVADHIETHLPATDRNGLWQLVDLLRGAGFARLPAGLRERELRLLRRAPGAVARGIDALIALTVMHFYGQGGADRPNPSWALTDYPGPPQVAPPRRARLQPLTPTAGEVLEADVCVVGSGAGGGVVAAEAAAAGRSVVVVEAGGYTDVDDVPDNEFDGFRPHLLARLSHRHRGRHRDAAGRCDAGGWHGRQLDQLRAAAPVGARRVGHGARPGRP